MSVQPLAAKARAVNARAAVQRVDAQSRIVRDGGQLRRLHDGLGLEKRILGKGLARFLHLDLYAEVGLRHDLHAELAQNSAHFLQFLGVLRCQNKFHRQTSHGSFSRLFLLFSSRFSSSRCALRSSRCALIFSCQAVNFLSSLSSGHSISGTGTMTTLQLSQ